MVFAVGVYGGDDRGVLGVDWAVSGVRREACWSLEKQISGLKPNPVWVYETEPKGSGYLQG